MSLLVECFFRSLAYMKREPRLKGTAPFSPQTQVLDAGRPSQQRGDAPTREAAGFLMIGVSSPFR